MLRSQVMGCQMHEIGKAIRPLFTDPVTNVVFKIDITFSVEPKKLSTRRDDREINLHKSWRFKTSHMH